MPTEKITLAEIIGRPADRKMERDSTAHRSGSADRAISLGSRSIWEITGQLAGCFRKSPPLGGPGWLDGPAKAGIDRILGAAIGQSRISPGPNRRLKKPAPKIKNLRQGIAVGFGGLS